MYVCVIQHDQSSIPTREISNEWYDQLKTYKIHLKRDIEEMKDDLYCPWVNLTIRAEYERHIEVAEKELERLNFYMILRGV